MPRGDGTGPFGGGPGTGRGIGRGQGAGNMSDGPLGRGPGGDCVCAACGTKVPHQPQTPCTLVNCPKCGAKMVRG